eukprot:jgi/Chlat1/3509/Chrsp23S03792
MVAAAAADGGFPYREAAIGFIVLVYLLESYLELRQHRKLRDGRTLPPQLRGIVSEEKFAKSRAYGLDKSRLSIAHEAYSLVENIVLIYYLPHLWNLSASVLARFGYTGYHEVLQSVVFLGITQVLETISELPWSVYSTFVVEQRHGFNKQTVRLFVMDIIKSLLLMAILMPPIAATAITIVNRTGPYFVLYLWLFVLALTLVAMTIYPVLIAPLFNKFTPLQEGSLRLKIEALAASLKFPLRKLFVVDGSTRSSHSNAYMYGFFNNKRIVLYDTLIAEHEEDIVAVIAHELGHWKLRHTVYLFLSSQVLVLTQFGGFAAVRGWTALFRSFGFVGDRRPVIIGFQLYSLIIGPLLKLVTFATSV